MKPKPEQKETQKKTRNHKAKEPLSHEELNQKRYLTIDEACQYLGFPSRYCRFGREYKKLVPYARVAGKVRFIRDDLDEYVLSTRRDERFLYS